MEVLFEWAVVLAIGLILWDVNPWIALFWVLAYTRALSTQSMMMVLFALMWWYAVATRPLNVNLMLDIICLIAILNLIFMILQYYRIDPIFERHYRFGRETSLTGFMANKNLASLLFAYCFPAFLRRRRFWGVVTVIIPGLIMSRSCGGMVAVGAGAIFYLVMTDRLWWTIPVVGAGLWYIFFDMPSFGRWEKVVAGLGVMGRNLEAGNYAPVLLGGGIDSWKNIFSKFGAAQAHNDVFQAFFEMGLGYLIVVTGYTTRILLYLKRYNLRDLTAMVTVTVGAMVHFPFHIAGLAMLGVTWMGLLERRGKNDNLK